MKLVDYFTQELSADPSPDEIVRGLDSAIANTEDSSLPWDECYELWEAYQKTTDGGAYTEAIEAVFKRWNGPTRSLRSSRRTLRATHLIRSRKNKTPSTECDGVGILFYNRQERYWGIYFLVR